MIALERKEDGWAATLGVAKPFRCDASSPIDQCSDIAPEYLAHLQCSTLHQVPSFRSCSRGVTATDGHAEAPDSARGTPQRANQCACKCDSDRHQDHSDLVLRPHENTLNARASTP